MMRVGGIILFPTLHQKDISTLRVLVTGGRIWHNKKETHAILDHINQEHGISVIIHGDAVGADRLCRDWAITRGIEHLSFPIRSSDWIRWGKKAGPRRNQQMIDEGHPDVLVVFLGQNGTNDMISRAKRTGIEIWDFTKVDK